MIPDTAKRDFMSDFTSLPGLGTAFFDSFCTAGCGKSKTRIAGLILVFVICEILINAIPGPFIDKLRIRTS
jgi:hypothetical protein